MMFIGGIALSAAGAAAIVFSLIERSTHRYELAILIGEPWAQLTALLLYLGIGMVVAGVIMLAAPIIKKRLAQRTPKPKKEKKKAPAPVRAAKNIRPAVPQKAAPRIFCAKCGTPMTAQMAFCPACGGKEKTAVPKAAQTQPAGAPAGVQTQPAGAPARVQTQPAGAPARVQTQPTASPARSQQKPAVCGKCGTPLPPGAAFCRECGYRIV